ncbi:MAG: energy-coupled thiamine transporter ThiT [Candidatus Riflebacteria bacterium HGW-Riflebacteria-1]|jgi:thiamine transporter|nr:MAG: energy-coupled thiamine transporter ThiT [Candidatus Riflebacteria bacterium HGW-Riflebacteria-1]
MLFKGGVNVRIRNLKVVTECGMLLAAALALSNIKLFQMPSGGSVSLGVLPLLLLAARHGVITGCVSGAMLGLLMLTTRPFIVHPVQMLLDYPLAYGVLGIAGAIQWKTPLQAATATTLANVIRLLLHVVAGAIFFVTGKDTVIQALTASTVYNLGHMFPETVICVILVSYIARNHQALCARQNT